jgi:membrane protease YdiL (CAAX protease family)
MSRGTSAIPTLRVAIEVSDDRVAGGLRQLLDSDSGIVIAEAEDADVAVVELAATAGPGAGIRISELARQRPVVVIGFDHHVEHAVAGLANVSFVDKLDADSALLVALRQAATRPSPTMPSATWPRIAVVTAAVFAGPWAFWVSAIAQAHGLVSWRLPQGLALWSMVPLLVAAVALTSGRPGLRDLGARVTRVRLPVRTYAAAVGLPLVIAGATAVIVTVAGGTVPYGQLLSLPAAVVYLIYGTGLFLLTEEAAWRGVLLPRVQHRLGAGRASIVVGLIWAGWHLPLLATPGESDQGLPIAPFLVLIVTTSVLMTALVNAGRGSVVIAGLFHASFDACYSWFGVVGDQHAMLWTAATITLLAAAGLLVLTRGGLFAPLPQGHVRTGPRTASHSGAAASPVRRTG